MEQEDYYPYRWPFAATTMRDRSRAFFSNFLATISKPLNYGTAVDSKDMRDNVVHVIENS